MSTQSAEAEAFIARVAWLPPGPISLDDVLKPSIEDEADLRRLWATDKTNPRLLNPYVGLVDVFAAPSGIRTTRARVISPKEPANAKYVFPLSDESRRKEGEPCMVDSVDEFKKNWGVFTEGSLSQLLDWNNVVASGGSVLACHSPLPEEVKGSRSKRAGRKWYHTTKYPASDVDLFLWGLNAEQAEKKIIQIYEAVRDSVPWDVTCVRTKHTVSIHSQYPYRSIQIVLRLYNSPAEILAGFDVDAPCCAYDGTRVLASPRSIIAQMRQCNTVDVTRRSPSYEVRLAKYASRGFEIYIPSLERENFDPTIYERAISRMHGLARLLVLEKLQSQNARDDFLISRRTLRERPIPLRLLRHVRARKQRKYKGDLKSQLFDLEMNDYDVASLHIPYGPGWDAGRVDRLVYRTDLGMNSGFNPKNNHRRLHRHPAFFGTAEECLEDCCEHCPEPTNEERAMQQEDKSFIRGRITFVQENPGRQSITGSFNPIDEGEWSEQVYVKPGHKIFAAIARGDLEEVKAILDSPLPSSPLPQPNLLDTRDHVGRTPLQLAIISRAENVALELIARGARITPRLVDGKMALHLAAERGLLGVVRGLLERSRVNEEGVVGEKKAEEVGEQEEEEERASSEDDWSSDEEGVEKKVDDSPDVLDVNLPDWDFGFTPLAYAILYADLDTVEALLGAGADVKLPMKNGQGPFHHLSLTLLRSEDDEEGTGKIIERLVLAGASCDATDDFLKTIFHQAVRVGNIGAVRKFLQCDSSAHKALNCPMVDYQDVTFPIVSAIANGDYAMLAVLLQAGAKMVFEEEDLTSALHVLDPFQRYKLRKSLDVAMTATEACLQETDDFIEVLLGLGAPVNIETKEALGSYMKNKRETLLDWVREKIKTLSKKIETRADEVTKKNIVESNDAAGLVGWKKYIWEVTKYQLETDETHRVDGYSWDNLHVWTYPEQLRLDKDRREYFVDIERLLVAHGGKTYNELHGGGEVVAAASIAANPLLTGEKAKLDSYKVPTEIELNKPIECRYIYISKEEYEMGRFIPEHLNSSYDELFEACYVGDNEKIKRLCLPAQSGDEEGSTLLHVSVMIKANHETDYEQSGWTPFFAAVLARQWSTAKLIVAIATAQYQSDDAEELKQLRTFEAGDHSDESDCEEEGDTTEELEAERRRVINYYDIAKRKSEVKSDIHPQVMLQFQSYHYVKKDGKYTTGKADLLWKAVDESDMETFVQVANLFQSLSSTPLTPDTGGSTNRYSRLIKIILTTDNADFLDEYIRRTGYGFDFKSETRDVEDEDPIVVNDQDRVYLGLNVHGKKRSDLAMKNDPNAAETVDKFVEPLLWKAIEHNSMEVVRYLTSDRPFEAYQFYALSHRGEERAERLLRIPDLQKAIPELVGWKMNSLGESPLTAAVLGGKVDMMKMLLTMSPALIKQALHQNIKFVGYNPILLAVAAGRDADVIDYLLSKSIPPAERDLVKGWNIYHFLCSVNNHELLEYFLAKLRRDISEALLVQQSKHCLNTPLLVAIKSGALCCVKLLLPYAETSLTLRDAGGSLPLHAAVRRGYAEITKLLISASPSETLFMENAVGHIALEIASLAYLNKRVADTVSSVQPPRYGVTRLGIYSNSSDGALRYKVTQLERSLPALKRAIETLEEEGEVRREDKLPIEMRKFASKMEERLVEAKKAEDVALSSDPQQTKKSIADSQNVKKTFEIVSQAARAISGNTRKVVHLLDVQLSVSTAVERKTLISKEEPTRDCDEFSEDYSRRRKRLKKMEKDVLVVEEAEEKKEMGRSLVFARVNGAMRTDELFD